MGLVAKLRADIAGRRSLIRSSQTLIARWEAELATAEHHRAEARHPLPRYGVDYAWGRPLPAELRKAGATFAGRYLTGEGKALSGREARALSAAGLAIVACFEEGASNMLGGERQGRIDGARARQAALLLGIPRGKPIYFACDFDAGGTVGAIPQCLAYMRGANAALGRDYQGALYGGLAIVRAALDEGYVHYAWQTLAWSGGIWDARAQLRQTAVGTPRIGGVECDTDYAHAADFGQWRL